MNPYTIEYLSNFVSKGFFSVNSILETVTLFLLKTVGRNIF